MHEYIIVKMVRKVTEKGSTTSHRSAPAAGNIQRTQCWAHNVLTLLITLSIRSNNKSIKQMSCIQAFSHIFQSQYRFIYIQIFIKFKLPPKWHFCCFYPTISFQYKLSNELLGFYSIHNIC